MKRSEPLHYVWWLISRASGIVALVLISLSVLMGLLMAARLLPRPTLKRSIARLHEQVALIALAAIAAHGLALLGDSWLKPRFDEIAVPFAMSYRPLFTGAGIVAGYLVVLLGPSFYVRRRLGAARWRRAHRLTVVVWLLAAIHTLGAGSDASKLWLRCIVLAPLVPLVYLVVMRALRNRRSGPRQRAPSAAHSGTRHGSSQLIAHRQPG